MKKFKTKNTLCSIKGSVTALSIAISVAISTTMVAFAADPVATSPETVFNLRISYYDTYENAVTNNRLDAIRANLKAFGTVLYEATNGKHKLGKVSVYFGGAFKDDTDILWVKSCWPNANVAGYKKPGSRIEHCDTFDTTPFLTNTLAGGVTLLHEWGHFGYGVYDEYKNDDVTCDANNPGSPCKNDVPTDKTLMNSHWDSMTETNGVSTLTDLRPLNFSRKGNFSKVTAQGRVYNMSAWDTLLTDPALDKSQIGRTFYPNLKDAAPADASDKFEIGSYSDATPPVLTLDTIKIETTVLNKFNVEFINGSVAPTTNNLVLTAGTDVVPAKDNSVSYILIDTSKEVTADQLTDAKGAIEAIIEGAEEGETIRVISYDNNSTEVVKPSRITDSNSKAAIMAEVANLSISASDYPDLTAAFKVALKNLPLGTVNSIYILGSGKNTNVDTDLLKWIGQYSVIVNALTTVNDPVIVKPLDSVAKETHGVFRLVNTSSDYFAALENANQASSPEIDATIVANDSLSLKANTTKNVPFYVDSTLGSLNFNLGYTGGADRAKLPEITLINPKGVKRVVIPDDECDVVQDAVGSSPQENFCNVELSDPKVGKWTLVIKPKEQTEVNFSLNGVAKSNDKAISSQIIFDDNTGVFTASVGDNIPMSGVRVTALVKDSKGKISTVVMNDNGKTGDLSSNDGIFTGKLINPTPGMYSINVSYDNSLGKASKTHKSGLYLPTTPGVSPDKVKSTPYKEAFMRNDISRVYFYGQ